MKKLLFVTGLGIGFILGSKAGPGPYREFEEKVRSLTRRPEVQDVVAKSKGLASDRVTDVVHKADERLPPSKEDVA